MNLYELRELVDEMIEAGYGEAVVVVSSDSEGNSFAKMSDSCGFGFYHPRYQEYWNEDDVESEEIDISEMKKAVAFWPGW